VNVYCFDLDGTLCSTTEGDYEKSEPLMNRISKVNDLYEAGHKILIFTARGSTTAIDWEKLTSKQLEKWGVKHHQLLMGKPYADFFIDDKGISDFDFFENSNLQ